VEFGDLIYVDALDKLVSSYNLTRHSAHKTTPREVYYGSKETVAEALETQLDYRKKRIFRGATQDTDIPIGTMVRIALRADPQERKNRIFKKKGYDTQWSEGLFKIDRHLVPHTETGNHYYTVEGKSKHYSRSELLIVSDLTENETVPDRRADSA
jgi:hypothetical protein